MTIYYKKKDPTDFGLKKVFFLILCRKTHLVRHTQDFLKAMHSLFLRHIPYYRS